MERMWEGPSFGTEPEADGGRNIPKWRMPEEKLAERIEKREILERFVEEQIKEFKKALGGKSSEEISRMPVKDFDINYYFPAFEFVGLAERLGRDDLKKQFEGFIEIFEKAKVVRQMNFIIGEEVKEVKWKHFRLKKK